MRQSFFIEMLETQLENQLTEMVSVFQNLSESALLQPSPTGGWSIQECIEHLNSYARFYLPRLEKLFEKEMTTAGEFKHTWIGLYFIRMMRSKQKYKAIKKHRPVNIVSSYEVSAEFIRHLESMTVLLHHARRKNLNKLMLSTSISSFVRINAGDALQFVLTHNERHLAQARRNSSLN